MDGWTGQKGVSKKMEKSGERGVYGTFLSLPHLLLSFFPSTRPIHNLM